MIRINLLPVRAAKKKEALRAQITIAVAATILVLLICLAVFIKVSATAYQLSSDIKKGNAELDELKKKIGELDKIKDEKKVVEEKLKVIDNLEAGRTGPVKLLDMIGEAMPEKMWLLSLKEDGPVITLRGSAMTDENVAEFLRKLQKQGGFTNVELVEARKAADKDTGLDVVIYEIKLERAR